MFSSEWWVLILILEYNGFHQWLLFERIVDTACFGRALTRFLQDQTASRCVKIVSYFASFDQEEFVSLISLSSKSSLFLAFLTFRIAAFTFPSVLLLIWSLIKSKSSTAERQQRRDVLTVLGSPSDTSIESRFCPSMQDDQFSVFCW